MGPAVFSREYLFAHGTYVSFHFYPRIVKPRRAFHAAVIARCHRMNHVEFFKLGPNKFRPSLALITSTLADILLLCAADGDTVRIVSWATTLNACPDSIEVCEISLSAYSVGGVFAEESSGRAAVEAAVRARLEENSGPATRTPSARSFLGPGGCALLVYSACLTRGVMAVRRDVDEELGELGSLVNVAVPPFFPSSFPPLGVMFKCLTAASSSSGYITA